MVGCAARAFGVLWLQRGRTHVRGAPSMVGEGVFLPKLGEDALGTKDGGPDRERQEGACGPQQGMREAQTEPTFEYKVDECIKGEPDEREPLSSRRGTRQQGARPEPRDEQERDDGCERVHRRCGEERLSDCHGATR